MSNNTLSEQLKTAYTSPKPQEFIIDTIEFKAISANSQDTPISIASIVKGVPNSSVESHAKTGTSLFNSWQAPIESGVNHSFSIVNFDMSLAPISSEPTPEMNIAIDNIGVILFQALDQALSQHKRINLLYRPYLSERINEGPQITPPPQLTITDVSANLQTVNIRARMLEIANRMFPSKIYNNSDFPGLLAI